MSNDKRSLDRSQGQRAARVRLVEDSYETMKRMAARRVAKERRDHTLSATALANEVSIKLLNDDHVPIDNEERFFAYLARSMRNLLIDHARRKGRQKRGGGRTRLSVEDAKITDHAAPNSPATAVNEALASLALRRPRLAKVVRMRYFDSMSIEQIATQLGISPATVKRDCQSAKTWLQVALRAD